jgi:hypothetical protein
MIKVATKFPGAIGYLPASDLTPEVQAVSIDSMAHTHPAYAITQ